jgi:hypothetical protein
LFQSSGAFCGDGTFIGACSGGCGPTRTATLEITGGEMLGDLVTVLFGNCEYVAVRKSVDFIPLQLSAAANPPDADCAESLELTEIRDGAAQLTVNPRPAEPGELVCVIQESGEIRRVS